MLDNTITTARQSQTQYNFINFKTKGTNMDMNKNLCNNELRKAGLLLIKASELGMDLNCYGEIDVNQTNGNVYLWCENHQFSLYITLGSDTIWACWTDFNDGSEEIIDATNESLYSLDDWVRENLDRTQPYDEATA